MMKFAGYDGLAIEGAASEPVWIDIRDETITIRPCRELSLWGLGTYDAQKKIWKYVAGSDTIDSWYSPEGTSGRTTQRPAVLAMGRAGETRCRMACLMHDSGFAVGAGGFGGVWGSKNLKALSIVGTGMVPVADPSAVMKERISNVKEYGPDIANFNLIQMSKGLLRHNFTIQPAEAYGKRPTDFVGKGPLASRRGEKKGPASCMGCYAGCRGRYESAKANEVRCAGCFFYGQAETRDIQYDATDLINQYGFNTFDFYQGTPYIKALADKGVIGPAGSGAPIECDLDFSKFGKLEWAAEFLKTIAERDTPFGNDLAEGFMRAIEKWGRTEDIGDASEEDKAHIPLPYWGLPEHHYDGRCQVEYGYGSILGDREICEHLFTTVYWDKWWGDTIPFRGYDATADESVTLITEKMLPHAQAYSSPEAAKIMMNYATENIYSEHMARLVSWHRHYTRLFKASLLFCDWRYPDIINSNKKDKRGASFTAEEQFFKAVTGKEVSYLEFMKTGRKIWILDNAIWALQGRHRDMVHYADYMYKEPYPGTWKMTTYDPSQKKAWEYREVGYRCLDRDQFEEFKTRYYAQEGWDTATGWPTRSTLESLGLGYVADALESWGKLGAE
jgi:aldehyde:ferredoxin oxidoreductase